MNLIFGGFDYGDLDELEEYWCETGSKLKGYITLEPWVVSQRYSSIGHLSLTYYGEFRYYAAIPSKG